MAMAVWVGRQKPRGRAVLNLNRCVGENVDCRDIVENVTIDLVSQSKIGPGVEMNSPSSSLVVDPEQVEALCRRVDKAKGFNRTWRLDLGVAGYNTGFSSSASWDWESKGIRNGCIFLGRMVHEMFGLVACCNGRVVDCRLCWMWGKVFLSGEMAKMRSSESRRKVEGWTRGPSCLKSFFEYVFVSPVTSGDRRIVDGDALAAPTTAPRACGFSGGIPGGGCASATW
jgi:hypothetical protein